MIHNKKIMCIALALVAGACTTTRVEQWESVRGAAVDQAYTRPAVDFGKYRHLLAAPFEVYYPEEIDSRSDEVLARAADEEKPEQGKDVAGGGENRAAVEAAAQRWASMFRGFLDRNLGKS